MKQIEYLKFSNAYIFECLNLSKSKIVHEKKKGFETNNTKVKFRNDKIGWVDKGLVNRIQYPEPTRK